MKPLNVTLGEEEVEKLDALCRQAGDWKLPDNRSAVLRMIIQVAPSDFGEVINKLSEKPYE